MPRLEFEISPSLLFENPAPRVMAERLRLAFEGQNPVHVGALKFNVKDKLQTTKDIFAQNTTLLSIISVLQKSMVWIALLWLVYQCYIDMVNRNIRWWSAELYFEGPGIEKAFRDTYHGGSSRYIEDRTIAALFMAIQSGLRFSPMPP